MDPYLYSGTNVLRNKAGIRESRALAEYEYGMTAIRLQELQESPIKGAFDLKHLRAIHQYIFQDVYDWAGKIRTVNISKGQSFFASAEQIENYGNSTVFKAIAEDGFLKGMRKEPFCQRLAYHYAEINALHPFREGNGRSSREFVRQLAKGAGYEIDYSKVDPKRWNAAAIDSFNGSIEPMARIFAKIVRWRAVSGKKHHE